MVLQEMYLAALDVLAALLWVQLSATVILNASQIVEDPGNPTMSVMWRWEDNDELISEQVSGQYRNFLKATVTREDKVREIIAVYDNTIGHTMQTFSLQCPKCKLLLCSILE